MIYDVSDIGEALLSSFKSKIEFRYVPSALGESVAFWEITSINGSSNTDNIKKLMIQLQFLAKKFLHTMSTSDVKECLEDYFEIFEEECDDLLPSVFAKYVVQKYLDTFTEDLEEKSCVDTENDETICIVIDFNSIQEDYKSSGILREKYPYSISITEEGNACDYCGDEGCSECGYCGSNECQCCCDEYDDEEDDDEDEDDGWDEDEDDEDEDEDEDDEDEE